MGVAATIATPYFGQTGNDACQITFVRDAPDEPIVPITPVDTPAPTPSATPVRAIPAFTG